MKKIVSSMLFTVTFTFASASVFGDYIAAAYTCELKDDKTEEEVMAVNSKWLKFVHENVSPDISSDMGTPLVGDFGSFLFVDTYPDVNTWAAAQTALDGDMGTELEGMFDELMECKKNRLWKFKETK